MGAHSHDAPSLCIILYPISFPSCKSIFVHRKLDADAATREFSKIHGILSALTIVLAWFPSNENLSMLFKY